MINKVWIKLKKESGLKITFIFFLTFTAISIHVKLFLHVYTLVTENYYINTNDVYKIDTFKMQGRAYQTFKGKNSKQGFNFISRNKYSFSLTGSFFDAVIYKDKLKDTLMYHDTQFIIYSDKKTFERYFKSKKPIFINIFQI